VEGNMTIVSAKAGSGSWPEIAFTFFALRHYILIRDAPDGSTHVHPALHYSWTSK
jgi:hypothetical protein